MAAGEPRRGMFSPGSGISGRSSPVNGLSSSGKRRAAVSDSMSTSPPSPTGAMTLSSSSSPSVTSMRSAMARASLSSSSSELIPAYADGESDVPGRHMTVVMQTQREWRNTVAPLDQRWARSITVVPFCSTIDSNGVSTAASEAVMQMQQRVMSNELWSGLQDVKEWVSFNVHRVLVPPSDPRERKISQLTPPAAFCVTISNDASGVRSYLQAVCCELRIDFFRVGGTYFEDGMMEDLLDEARRRRRALILFDRTSWFSHNEYAHRGASFMHHLHAAMNSMQAFRAAQGVQDGPATSIQNPMCLDTLSTLLPNLWIVVSSNNTDVVPDVLRMASGCVFRISNASEAMALSVVRIQLQRRGREYDFPDAQVEETLSQSAYSNEIQRIANTLQRYEVGAIVNIIAIACTIAYQRRRFLPTHSTSLVSLMPTLIDVQQAVNQLNGHSVGGLANALATTATSTQAAEAARAINGRQ